MNIGELWASLGIDDTPFGEGLRGALAQLTDFQGKGVAIAGAAGLGIAMAFGASLTQNMSLEAAQDKIAAELGLTEAESAKAGKNAGKLYADGYGESLVEVNEAVGTVIGTIDGMRTASGRAVREATRDALNFAKVFDVDVAQSTQQVNQLIRNGLAKDARGAFDLMSAGLQAVSEDMRGDALDTLNEYGGRLAQLGLDGPQVMGLIAASTRDGGFAVDKAADSLKEFTLKVGDLNDTSARDALKAIGLDANQMANDMVAGGERGGRAMDAIVDGLLDIKDPAQQTATAIQLFGDPLTEIGTDRIPGFLKALDEGGQGMDDVAGAADRLDRTLNDNASATLDKWKNRAELAFLGLANWAIPAINDTAKAIDKFMSTNDNAANVVKVLAGAITLLLIPAIIRWGVTSTVAGAKAAWAWTMTQLAAYRSVAAHVAGVAYIIAMWIAMGAAAAAQAIRVGLAWVIGFVTGAAVAVASMAVTVATVVAGWVLMGVQAMAQAVRMAAAWLIAMGPIGWVILAVIALVALIVAKWDWVKAKTVAIWGALVGFVKGVPGKIAAFFMNWTLPGLIIKHWDSIKRAFSNGVDKVVSLVSGLKNKVTGAISGATEWLIGVGEDIMSGLVAGIERGFAWVRGKLSGVGRMIPGWLKSVLGINSPSTVMRDEVGVHIPGGVAEGVERATPQVRAAVEAMAAAAMLPISTSATVGVVGDLTARALPVAAGPFAGLAGEDGVIKAVAYLTDEQMRMLADAVEHGTDRQIKQDRYRESIPSPSGGLE